MKIRLALIMFLVLTACAPVTPQIQPTSAPPTQEAPLSLTEPTPVIPSATPLPQPEYETSVIVSLWGNQARTYQIVPVEPSSGQAVPGYPPIRVGVNFYHAFSPDRKTLVIVSYQSDTPRDPILHNIDLTTWQETSTQLDGAGWTAGLAFHPDGKSVAMGLNDRQSTLLVFDLEKNQVLAQVTPEFDISRLKFTSDGSALMVYGKTIINRFTANEQTSGFAQAALFSMQDLSLLWSEELDGVREGIYPTDAAAAETTDLHADPEAAIYLQPGSIFAPDRDSLYIVHADEDKFTTVDFDARSISTVTIAPKLTWLERFLLLTTDVAHAKVANGSSRSAVISPDGSTVYTIGSRYESTQSSDGEWTFTQTPLGLQGIDTSDGTERFKLDISASDLRVLPDGDSLVLHTWDELISTDVLDAKSREVTSQFRDVTLVPAYRMNGMPVLLSTVTDVNNQTHMVAYSMDGEFLGEWLVNGFGAWFVTP